MQLYKSLEILQEKDILDGINNIIDDFDSCCLLNSNNFSKDSNTQYKWINAFGHHDFIRCDSSETDCFTRLSSFQKKHQNEWIFGFISYDLKNNIEDLSSDNIDFLNFPIFYFFIPKFLILASDSIDLLKHESIDQAEAESLFSKLTQDNNPKQSIPDVSLKFTHRFSSKEYIESIEMIRQHIKQGDIYEMNFCQEFYSENAHISPFKTYKKLNSISPAPFSAYVKENNHHLICASPERYIQNVDGKIISQPIKGTAKRSKDTEKDDEIKHELQNNSKERAENIMIVDLVRNDLSKISEDNSINVDELCEIYSFPQVHQMISSISGKLRSNTSFSDVLESSFPMGSMTGAPKVKAMELIEKYEKTKRGLFSGSVGYIDPDGNFDFNVIIRSLLYNETNKYLSLSTGGAITYKSNAKDEYQESLLKAKAVFELFA